MNKISVKLNSEDLAALSTLAQREYREVCQQAALIIRGELIRRGLLAVANDCPDHLQPFHESLAVQEVVDVTN